MKNYHILYLEGTTVQLYNYTWEVFSGSLTGRAAILLVMNHLRTFSLTNLLYRLYSSE